LTARGVDLVVVGTSTDPHVDRVLGALPDDVSVARIDVDNFPRSHSLTIDTGGRAAQLVLDHRELAVPLRRPLVGWFRRLGQPGLDPRLDPKYLRFALGEANHVLEAFVEMLEPGHWINDYWATRRASLKPLQYRLASECGLQTPAAIFSNSERESTEWLDAHASVVAKSISTPVVFDEDDERGFAFTHVLSPEERSATAAISVTPVQLQEMVEPSFEVRLLTVGNAHVGVRIDSDVVESQGVRDWRSDRLRSAYSWTDVPDEIATRVSGLLGRLGLVYAASDFIVDADGHWHFLEANPHGAWLWLEDALGEARFTAQFASHIIARARENT
jgi:hypothetical protein